MYDVGNGKEENEGEWHFEVRVFNERYPYSHRFACQGLNMGKVLPALPMQPMPSNQSMGELPLLRFIPELHALTNQAIR